MPTLAPAQAWRSLDCICLEASIALSALLCALVQISLQYLPRAYLNSLAPMKPGRLNIVQTSRLPPGFKNPIKFFISNFTILLS